MHLLNRVTWQDFEAEELHSNKESDFENLSLCSVHLNPGPAGETGNHHVDSPVIFKLKALFLLRFMVRGAWLSRLHVKKLYLKRNQCI